MTAINSQEDFLRALSENPEWRAAVRAQIIGDEQLQLPGRFDAFVEQVSAFIEEQKQFNAEIRAFVEEQKQFNADVIIEATQADDATCYIAVEASGTAGHRDADRALRNADFLTRFTGIPAYPCIVSVRNDCELSPDVLQGSVFWYPIPDQFWEAE